MRERTLVETYSVADRAWELTTNSDALLAAARESFPGGQAAPAPSPHFRLHLRETNTTGNGTWTRPVCRGRDHLAFCCVGDESVILFDYRRRIAVGSVTRSVAAATRYWREVVFPFALGVMAPVLRAVPLHAACFRYRNQGVLLGARSGAGKSTLAAALARRGVEFLSDDWVYLTADRGLRAYALPVPLKLLPDARRFFPELQSFAPAEAPNGEWSIAFDPAEVFHSPRGYRCEPDLVILFDRVRGAETSVSEARTEDLLDWFSEPLDCVPACLEIERQEQVALIRSLRSSRCYVVRCDGTPDEIATKMLLLCDDTGSISGPDSNVRTSRIEHLDLLRRGEPAPHHKTVDIGGIAAAIRTNHRDVLEQFPAAAVEPDFHMTLIVEGESWPGASSASAHQCDALGYISLGNDGLIAYDAEQRESAAFVSEAAVRTRRFCHELRRIASRFERTPAAIT